MSVLIKTLVRIWTWACIDGFSTSLSLLPPSWEKLNTIFEKAYNYFRWAHRNDVDREVVTNHVFVKDPIKYKIGKNVSARNMRFFL